MLRRLVRHVLDQMVPMIEDALPAALVERHGFPDWADALRVAHFPEDLEAAKVARNRFAYEELLGVQLGVLLARSMHRHEHKPNRHTIDGPRLAALRESLPFTLTRGQQCAVRDILDDMASSRPMVRLLQGDVGCGKTVVALHAIAAACDGGFQTALMAPTEILAEQHALTLRELLAPVDIEVVALTGATGNAGTLRNRIANGDVPVVVGTHALIQGQTAFHRLGLAIIDEQHRFGVVQRAALAEKGLQPDVLHMTATPIPRTLAITVYGGMDLSVIDELPPGRTPVKTRRVLPNKVANLYTYIRDQAAAGRQTYIVCPLVEESDFRDLTAVTSHFEQLRSGPLAGLRLGLIHGRLPADEKDAVMQAFKRGETDVLVSTSVIEVGIDCPNATTIAIEDAAQFGLTQLHQLRGRVGRGGRVGQAGAESYCFLLGKHNTPEGRKRLEIVCGTSNGFEIAEADLELRGPGEFRGVRQTGLSDLRVADLIRDVRLLDAARRDAQELLHQDPLLSQPGHTALARTARAFADLTA
jgi:ATP-dependent DNA helicase RecG